MRLLINGLPRCPQAALYPSKVRLDGMSGFELGISVSVFKDVVIAAQIGRKKNTYLGNMTRRNMQLKHIKYK
jgi:hypothetical protein